MPRAHGPSRHVLGSVDTLAELIELRISRGLVERSGNHLSFAETTLGNGREKSRDALAQSPELQSTFRKAISASGPVRPGRRRPPHDHQHETRDLKLSPEREAAATGRPRRRSDDALTPVETSETGSAAAASTFRMQEGLMSTIASALPVADAETFASSSIGIAAAVVAAVLAFVFFGR